jgi:hypothetical protein
LLPLIKRLKGKPTASGSLFWRWTIEHILQPGSILLPLSNFQLGIKPLLNAPWAQYLITQKVPLLSDDEAAIIKNFSDHQKITAFGIRRILNIPVLRTATCIGTVNCLYTTTTTTTTTTTSTPPTADEHLMNAVARHLAQTGIL